jgi:hypothetical protein
MFAMIDGRIESFSLRIQVILRLNIFLFLPSNMAAIMSLCKTSLAYLGDFASREPVPIYQTLAGAP